MSSKLVKKGLDFVSSAVEPSQKKQKGQSNKTKRNPRQRSAPYKSQSKKGKLNKQKQDFTEQNLQYFKRSTWTMKRDVYEKIVQNQDKRLKIDKNAEPSEDKEDLEE